MVTTTGIIYMVIFSTLGLKGNTENIHPVRQNATVGQKGVLKCNHPFSSREKIIAYWKKDNNLICYMSTGQDSDCQGYQIDASDGQSILIIPKLTASASGRYISSLFTENTTYECAIDLLVQAGNHTTVGLESHGGQIG
ncbi:uncharacterized protein LOC144479844 isoform X2 [Mustelus asterias]